MKWRRASILSITLSFGTFLAASQVKFRTIVPPHSVIVGESFQVQYVIENATPFESFSVPSFKGLKLVTGPDVYNSNSGQSKNIVLTLSAIRDGKFKIPGAICIINGQRFRSNDAFLSVTSVESSQSAYFLAPGEDPWKKIKENLYLKLVLDKHTCFIGEPLVATFKLYSRLQSKSNVIKNPGCYGFSVYDMINVNDHVQAEEKIGGRWFDVHTVRKVQLYPLQAGSLIIDPMEVANRVEFSRSVINKRTEQEISENMYNRQSKEDNATGIESYEMTLRTNPVKIIVKPLPVKTVTDTFTGAVGIFSIKAVVEKDTLVQNEANSLVVDIIGAGNFQRIPPPVIHWPHGVENFEPSTDDMLTADQIPLTGRRRFKYRFVSNEPGEHIVPAISFSYFDLQAKVYKTVSTKDHRFFVADAGRVEKRPALISVQPKRVQWFEAVGLGLILAVAIWIIARARSRKPDRPAAEVTKKPDHPSLDETFHTVELKLASDEKHFFASLEQALWNFFQQRLSLTGSELNKCIIRRSLALKGISTDEVNEILKVIELTQVGVYGDATLKVDRQQLLEQTKQVLGRIQQFII